MAAAYLVALFSLFCVRLCVQRCISLSQRCKPLILSERSLFLSERSLSFRLEYSVFFLEYSIPLQLPEHSSLGYCVVSYTQISKENDYMAGLPLPIRRIVPIKATFFHSSGTLQTPKSHSEVHTMHIHFLLFFSDIP